MSLQTDVPKGADVLLVAEILRNKLIVDETESKRYTETLKSSFESTMRIVSEQVSGTFGRV